MKDKRITKVKQHFDLFLDDRKFKVTSCRISDADGTLSIKTKIFGQPFPHDGHFILTIPSQNTVRNLSLAFRSMTKDPAIEHWEYSFRKEADTHETTVDHPACIDLSPDGL